MTSHPEQQPTRPDGPALVLDADLRPEGFLVGCPASAIAVLNVKEPVRVWCCELEGHDGNHRFHIEWSDPR